MEKVKIGIIGLGSMGKGHGNSLLSGLISHGELVAVCDICEINDPVFGEMKHYSDYKKMIKSGNIDAVIIATPHYQHTEIAIFALENGVHVLLEKPISVHKEDCEKIIDVALKNKELKFAAMFNQRTLPWNKKIKEIISSGEIGEIKRVSWIITNWFRTQAYYESSSWRATWKGEGGGVLLNQCPHQLDLLCWFLGMPQKLTAVCNFGKHHSIEVEDEVSAILEYPNRAMGVFMTSTGEFPGSNHLEIAGDLGTISLDNGKLTFIKTAESVSLFSQNTKEAWGVPESKKIEIILDNPVIIEHPAIIQNFVNSIMFDEEIIANGEEGIMSVELANAMLLSQLQKTQVMLPIDSHVFAEELNKLKN